APEKTQETSSPTNPARRARTIPVRDLVPKSQSPQVSQAPAIFPRTAGQASVQKPREHRWMYKSPPPCRTVPRHASNSPAQDRGERRRVDAGRSIQIVDDRGRGDEVRNNKYAQGPQNL